MAPVLNLSNRDDWDPLKLTDILASELQSFPGIAVVPVNRSFAALMSEGRSVCETPADAVGLARRFGASATVVAAVTEFDPYDPPRIGLTVQWYSAESGESAAPTWQVQRTFDASHEGVQRELRKYDTDRRALRSPFGFRAHTQSQEMFARFCFWSSILTMQEQRSTSHVAYVEPGAEP